MLIKAADDKRKRLALLEDLQKSNLLDARQKEWLRDELRRCKAGMEGERAAAFYLDGHYKDGQNNILLHDLRFQVDGEVAQIPKSSSVPIATAKSAFPKASSAGTTSSALVGCSTVASIRGCLREDNQPLGE